MNILALVVFGLGMAAQPPEQKLRVEATRLLEAGGFSGSLEVRDVRSGRTIVSVERGAGGLELPLSAAKLFLAAIYFDHENRFRANERPDIDLVIARGSDDAGRKLALDLRRRLGSQLFLAELARLGFPSCSNSRRVDCTTLSPSSTDRQWSDSLSLGESGFRTSPVGLSRFLALVGNDGRSGRRQRISRRAASETRRAMIETVSSGTARGSAAVLDSIGFMGGKTGTTGIGGEKPFDGLFAGLIFDRRGRPLYSVVTYVRRGGFGGGAAARISAQIGVSILTGRFASKR